MHVPGAVSGRGWIDTCTFNGYTRVLGERLCE
jgi:hypothetical protein